MNPRRIVRIDIRAANALTRWKQLFAEEVCSQAKRLAAESDPEGDLSLKHYRQAAEHALQVLSAAIHQGEDCDADPQAA